MWRWRVECTATVEDVTGVEGGEYWVLEAREVQWRTEKIVSTSTSNRLLLSQQTGCWVTLPCSVPLSTTGWDQIGGFILPKE